MRVLGLFLVSTVAALAAAEPDVATLPFQEFDQTPGKGWRRLEEDRKYEAAGRLIDEYLLKSPEGKRMAGILNFHAGQMYACAGKYQIAKERFVLSLHRRPEPLLQQWDDYVLGTIAFLDGDRKAIEMYRAKIVSGPDGSMKDSNSKVLDRLLANLGKPYQEALLEKRPNQAPGPTPGSATAPPRN